MLFAVALKLTFGGVNFLSNGLIYFNKFVDKLIINI